MKMIIMVWCAAQVWMSITRSQVLWLNILEFWVITNDGISSCMIKARYNRWGWYYSCIFYVAVVVSLSCCDDGCPVFMIMTILLCKQKQSCYNSLNRKTKMICISWEGSSMILLITISHVNMLLSRCWNLKSPKCSCKFEGER